MKHEYREGKDARENFDAAMKKLFTAPKTFSMARHKKKRKSKTSAKGRASGAKPTSD